MIGEVRLNVEDEESAICSLFNSLQVYFFILFLPLLFSSLFPETININSIYVYPDQLY